MKLTVAAKWNGKVIRTKTHSVSSVRSLARLMADYRDNAEEIGGYPEIVADADEGTISGKLMAIGVSPRDLPDTYDHVMVNGERIPLHWNGVRPSCQ